MFIKKSNEVKEKQMHITVKNVSEDGRTFEGVLSHYDNIDRDGDVIVSGAFKDSVATKNKVALLFNHNKSMPVGFLELTDTPNSVNCKGTIYSGETCDTVYQLLKDGAITEMSIGFYIEEFNYIDTGYSITKGTIVEGSVVYMPANPLATINHVKNKEEENMSKVTLVNELDSEVVEQKATSTETATETIQTNKAAEATPVEKTQLTEINKTISAQQVNVSKEKMQYLKTKESANDFLDILRRNPKNFKNAWESHLQTKGVEGLDLILPAPIMSEIEDNVKTINLIPFLKNVVGTSDLVGREENNELGSGHNPDKNKVKKEQNVKFVRKQLGCQFIYKLQVLSKEITRKDSNGLLWDFITRELPIRLLKTVEKAIVIGDGLDESSEYKIFSYEPIVNADPYFTTKLYAETENINANNVINKAARKLRSGAYVILCTRDYHFDLQGAKDNGNNVYVKDNVSIGGITYPTIEGNPVIECDFLEEEATINAIFLSQNAYERLHSGSFDSYFDFAIETNEDKLLIESYEGGALVRKDSAVVVYSGTKPTEV